MKRKAQLNIGDRIQIVRKRRNRSIMYASQVANNCWKIGSNFYK